MAKQIVPTVQDTSPWIAISISLIALIISIIALNQSSRAFPENQLQQYQDEVRKIQQKTQLETARDRLEDLRTDIVAKTNTEKVLNDIADIQTDLKENFAVTSSEAQNKWDAINKDFDNLGEEIKSKSIDAINTFNALLLKLKNQIQEG